MYELLYPLPPKQSLGSYTNCGTNDNVRIWKGLSANPSYFGPGTSGSRKVKQHYGQQGAKHDNDSKIKSKVVQLEEYFPENKILMVTANQTINISNSYLPVLQKSNSTLDF